MDRTVVAEGVETEAQIEALLALGCHLMQGYGIAMPMPADACTAWLEVRETGWAAADPNRSGHTAARAH
jgi:EAL domain-containing protein (putative c-di-GMP-specific phosphodiesterase class I)